MLIIIEYLRKLSFLSNFLNAINQEDYSTVIILWMQVIITSFGEINENEFLDPRTAQVAIVDHIKQVSCLI